MVGIARVGATAGAIGIGVTAFPTEIRIPAGVRGGTTHIQAGDALMKAGIAHRTGVGFEGAGLFVHPHSMLRCLAPTRGVG